MYVGNRHVAVATTTEELVFDCPKCNYYAHVTVVGMGEGVGVSPYMMREQAAATEAVDAAESAAFADTMVVIGITPCPKCAHRSRGAVARSMLKQSMPVWGFVIGLALVMAMFGKTLLLPLAIAIAFFILLGVFLAARQVSLATRRIRFHEKTNPAAADG